MATVHFAFVYWFILIVTQIRIYHKHIYLRINFQDELSLVNSMVQFGRTFKDRSRNKHWNCELGVMFPPDDVGSSLETRN